MVALLIRIATNQLKIAHQIDLDSFQGIDKHRELGLLQKSTNFRCKSKTDCIQNRHLNLHMEALCSAYIKHTLMFYWIERGLQL